MKKAAGKINKLQFFSETTVNRYFRKTSYIATFQLNSLPVRLTTPNYVALNNNDDILVAGKERHGILNVLAYNNLTTSASDRSPVGRHMLPGFIFLVIGGALSIAPDEEMMFFGLGAAFLTLGIWEIILAVQIIKAYRAVILQRHVSTK